MSQLAQRVIPPFLVRIIGKLIFKRRLPCSFQVLGRALSL